jgi:hypothetical protein
MWQNLNRRTLRTSLAREYWVLKNFPTFYGTPLQLVTRARLPDPLQTHDYILTLQINIYINLPPISRSQVSPALPTKSFTLCPTCLAYLTLLDMITVIILGEQSTGIIYEQVQCQTAFPITAWTVATYWQFSPTITLLNPLLLYLWWQGFHFDHFTDGRTPFCGIWTPDPGSKYMPQTGSYITTPQKKLAQLPYSLWQDLNSFLRWFKFV